MRKTLVADLILLGISALWGVTFVVVQNAIDVLPPYSFIAIRFFIAFLALLPFLFILRNRERKEQKNGEQIIVGNSKQSHKQDRRNLFVAGIILGLFLFMGYAFQTIGLLYTTSSKAGFITGLSVVLVPFFAFIVLRITPKLPAIFGVILAAVGLYYLTLGETLIPNKGDILVVFCAIGFALQIVFTGKYSKYFDALSLTLLQLGTVSVLSFLFALRFEGVHHMISLDVLLDQRVLIALVITSIFATSLAFLAQTYFQRFTTPTRVALIFATEPVFAAIAGVLWANEVLGVKALIGSALILGGMILAELPIDSFTRHFKPKEQSQ